MTWCRASFTSAAVARPISSKAFSEIPSSCPSSQPQAPAWSPHPQASCRGVSLRSTSTGLPSLNPLARLGLSMTRRAASSSLSKALATESNTEACGSGTRFSLIVAPLHSRIMLLSRLSLRGRVCHRRFVHRRTQPHRGRRRAAVSALGRQSLGHGILHAFPAEQCAFDAHRILGNTLEHDAVFQFLLGMLIVKTFAP